MLQSMGSQRAGPTEQLNDSSQVYAASETGVCALGAQHVLRLSAAS